MCASVACAALLSPGAARAQPRSFDIPAEDAGRSIPELARQAGVQIVAPGQALHGLVTPAIKGRFEIQDALAKMLYGSNLSVASDDGHTIVLAVAAAAAPDNTTLPEQIELIERAFVTGSRIISDTSKSPAPEMAFSVDELLATTPSNISDALNKLPVFQGSSSASTADGASANDGGDFLNLRNFGQQRTLVLLDGMRVPASNANGSVDVSTLPQMLMTRVDIVTGGASAVYGSDAITGVVNFILNKNFDGVKYKANTGISDYGDGMSYKAGAAAGTSLFGGRGHIETALEYYKSDGVMKRNRPGGAANWASYGLGTVASPYTNLIQGRLNPESFGGKITCTNCSVNGQQFIADGVIGPFNYGIVPVPGGSVSSGGDGVFVDYTSAIAATKRAESFARFSYNLNNDTVFWVQGTAAESTVFNKFFPSQIDNGRQTTKYFKNNPFLPAAAQTQLGNNGLYDSSNIFNIQKWYNSPEFTRATNATSRNLVVSAGLDGKLLGRYDWNAHYTHGESRTSVKGINNGNNQYHDAQQDAVPDPSGNGGIVCYNDTPAAIALYGDLYPGCVPANVFGPTALTKEAYKYWSRTTKFTLTNIMDNLSANISGDVLDLPAGPIRAALSGEMRWLDYIIHSDASPTALVNCTGLRLCGGPTQTLWDNNTVASVQASESVWEFAGETNIPVIKDVAWVQSFDINAAARYTDYDISGVAQTWKVGLNWRVNDDIRFRGTTSIDIRAPTLNDLFAPISSTSVGYFDLLTNYAGTGTQRVSQGNPKLVPEVARTYTVGVVLTPTFIPGLTASVDFYNINLKNAIGGVSGADAQVQALCNNSGGTSTYCQLYQRPLAFGAPGYDTPANYPTAVFFQNLNSAFQSTEGEDYEIDYRFNLSDIDETMPGEVTLRALLNVAPKINGRAFPGAQITHTTNPKGHATVFAGYTMGNWSVDTQVNWFSGAWKNGLLETPQIYAQPRVPSFNTADITISKRITFDNNSNARVYLSVQNIANANPPINKGSSGNPGYGIPVLVGESVMGRYFTIGIRGNL